MNSSVGGLLAEFTTAPALATAAREAREAGYRRLDAFTPYPVEGLELPGSRRPWIALIMLAGAVAGAAGGYLMQYYLNVVNYPINVGGRPLNSWPAFIPVAFELGVLTAALVGVVAFFVMSRLPEPYYPLFDVPGFQRATRDRFFLLIEARDPRFGPGETRAFLHSLHPTEVHDVPR